VERRFNDPKERIVNGSRKVLRQLFALSLLAGPLAAAVYTPTRYDDPAPNGCLPADCSLREAVIAANADEESNDTIRLSAGRYELTRAGAGEDDGLTGDLDLVGDVELEGPGARMTTIDANGLDRVLDFLPMEGGSAKVSGVSLVAGSVASLGGCVRLRFSGSVEMRETHVAQCTSDDSAVYVSIFASLNAFDSLIEGVNSSGLMFNQGNGILQNVTVANSASRPLNLVSDSNVYCDHCTLFGGPGSLDLIVTFNSTLQLANSILAGGNCGTANGGTIDSFGGNLESPGDTCSLDLGSDQTDVANPMLGPLADNGGATDTAHPLNGSPVIDNANDAFCLETDQRGAGRPDANCDAGAVEWDSFPAASPIFHDGFEQGNSGAWSLTVD
jgi:hypothetical protein